MIGLLLNLWVAGRFYRRTDGDLVDINSFEKAEDNILFYVLSMVPLFISAEFNDVYDHWIFAILYLSIVVVCLTSNKVFINPILYSFGMRFFNAEVSHNEAVDNIVILSNSSKLSTTERIRISELGSDKWYISVSGK